MTDQPALFDVPAAAYAEPPAPLTPGERLRRRQAAAIALGYHPLCNRQANLRLLDQKARSATTAELARDLGVTETCGTCRWRVTDGSHARDYPKCAFSAPTHPGTGAPMLTYARRVTGGPATDLRSWWPGCTDYEATPPTKGDTDR